MRPGVFVAVAIIAWTGLALLVGGPGCACAAAGLGTEPSRGCVPHQDRRRGEASLPRRSSRGARWLRHSVSCGGQTFAVDGISRGRGPPLPWTRLRADLAVLHRRVVAARLHLMVTEDLMLSKLDLTRVAERILGELGKKNAERLRTIIGVAGEDGQVVLADVLDTVYPGVARDTALAALRQFRLEVAKAAKDAGIPFSFESDSGTRRDPRDVRGGGRRRRSGHHSHWKHPPGRWQTNMRTPPSRSPCHETFAATARR